MAKRSGCPAKGKPPPSNTFLHGVCLMACVCAGVSLSAGPRKRSAAGRYTSDAVPAVVPDGGKNALSGLRVLPQAQTAQARASAAPPGDIHQTPYPQLCRIAASPYPAYGSSRRLKQRRPAQAQRRRAIYIRRRTRGCAGWRLRLIRPTGPPAGSNSVGPRKRSAAGRYTSDAVPAVVPDGGINALSGLRVLPQAQTAQARASAAPPGDIHQTPYPQLCRMAA